MEKRHFFKRLSLCLLATYLLTSLIFSTFISPALADGNDNITRSEIIDIAEKYGMHQWTATEDNVCHKVTRGNGCCAAWENGICVEWVDCRIDTPDENCRESCCEGRGWWAITEGDEKNIGIPYQWGGFSSIAEVISKDENEEIYNTWDFDKRKDEGKCAGDVYCYGGREGDAVGVDCSGFVSRCWRRNQKRSTYSLLKIVHPIKFEDLKPGDILDNPGNHVMLLKEFLNPEKTRIRVYEASAWDWKVSEREYEVVKLIDNPLVYNPKTYKYEIFQGKNYGATLRHDSSTMDYWAYTPFVQIDIVLVIDRSGSMGSESKMESAKSAAKMFVDLMQTGDKIGVVDFDDRVSVTYHLTEVDPEGTVKTAAKNAIDTLYDRGNTSIGGGLRAGQDELNTRGAGDPVRVMVLLSDGLENSAPYVADVLPGIIDDKIAVHTVGLGSDADQDLLKSIADQTGGVYRFSPSDQELQGIYSSISAAVYGESVCKTASGKVASGETAEKKVLVDSTIEKVTFSLFWSGSDLDLTLVQPDEKVIDPSVAETDPNISFVSGATYEFYKVTAPLYGEWTVRVFGSSTPFEGEEYDISISAMDTIVFSAESDKTKYYPGTPIRITASIIDDAGIDMPEHWYILGADIEVTVEDPAQNVYFFDLYDDGLHEDGKVNDGIYANTFTSTSLLGSYNFSVKASGLNNRDRQPFTREFALSTVVTTSPVRRVYLPLILKNYPPDTTPPAAVTNLATGNPTVDSITLNWTAPGDDGNIGTASQYDIRWSTSPITDANWPAAAKCVGEPAPQPAGSRETFTVHGLTPNTTYYFALKTADGVPNWSGLSNVASGATQRPSDQLIINCGFETDEGWVFGESPRPAAYTTEDAHWGARSVRLGIKPPTTDAYSWSSVRQRITIPANAASAALSFWYKPFTECTCRNNWQQFDWSDYSVDQPGRIPPDRNPRTWASCDWQQALILADDFPNPAILATVMNTNSNSGMWTHQTFDLTPFAGQTVWVYFNVYNDGWGYRRTWMYVDDASVMVYY